jgi:hypothetical protein
LLIKTGQPVSEETVAPLADDLARRIEPGRDDIIPEAFGRQQHDLGANDVTIW